MGWLNRLLGSRTSDPSPSFDALQPGDEVWSGGQPWQVTAVLTYKNAEGTWPVVRIQQALTTVWTSVEDDRPVRYDHLDLHVGGGRAGGLERAGLHAAGGRHRQHRAGRW